MKSIKALAIAAALLAVAGIAAGCPKPGCITVIAPNGGESWVLGTSQVVIWDAEHVRGNVRIYLVRGGLVRWSIGEAPASAGVWTWQPAISLDAGADYQIFIEAVDDPAAADISDGFFILAEAPVR